MRCSHLSETQIFPFSLGIYSYSAISEFSFCCSATNGDMIKTHLSSSFAVSEYARDPDRNAISFLVLHFIFAFRCARRLGSRGERGAVHRQCDGFAFLQRGNARLSRARVTRDTSLDSGGGWEKVLTHINCVSR